MIYVRQGDAEPKVCLIQLLLNTRGDSGPLVVDGHFGPKTRQAVVKFQRKQHLPASGIVEKMTWAKLSAGSQFGVIDALDFSDAVVPRSGGPHKSKIFDTSTAALEDLTAAGAEPIVIGAMSRAGGQILATILQQSVRYRGVVLMRFFGHGSPGVMHVTGEDPISLEGFAKIAPNLARLTPRFARFGSVEMHGCQVARGGKGKLLLQRLAALWGVPVTAAEGTQYDSGSMKEAVRFEGRTFTAFPRSGNLRSWAAQFGGMCI